MEIIDSIKDHLTDNDYLILANRLGKYHQYYELVDHLILMETYDHHYYFREHNWEIYVCLPPLGELDLEFVTDTDLSFAMVECTFFSKDFLSYVQISVDYGSIEGLSCGEAKKQIHMEYPLIIQSLARKLWKELIDDLEF